MGKFDKCKKCSNRSFKTGEWLSIKDLCTKSTDDKNLLTELYKTGECGYFKPKEEVDE